MLATITATRDRLRGGGLGPSHVPPVFCTSPVPSDRGGPATDDESPGCEPSASPFGRFTGGGVSSERATFAPSTGGAAGGSPMPGLVAPLVTALIAPASDGSDGGVTAVAG